MEPQGDGPAARQKQILIGLGGVVAVVAILVGVLALTDDDDTSTTTTTSSTSTVAEDTTTTTGPTTTTTLDPGVTDQALFPAPAGSATFTDPREIARAFALEVLGFRADMVVGDYAAGDSRSGEVEVRAQQQGQPTIVLVRQLADDDRWFVIGAATESIEVATPIPGARITSPQPVIGRATAFEGHVDVTLLADGSNEPIGTSFVTGRGDGVLGSYSGEIEFEVPAGVTHGVLVLSAPSGQDGSTIAATAIRVRF
jgi:hypothetical protein